MSFYVWLNWYFLLYRNNFWCIRKSYNKGWVLFSLVMFFILHSALAGHILFDGVPMTAGVILVNILDRRKEVQAEFKI